MTGRSDVGLSAVVTVGTGEDTDDNDDDDDDADAVLFIVDVESDGATVKGDATTPSLVGGSVRIGFDNSLAFFPDDDDAVALLVGVVVRIDGVTVNGAILTRSSAGGSVGIGIVDDSLPTSVIFMGYASLYHSTVRRIPSSKGTKDRYPKKYSLFVILAQV